MFLHLAYLWVFVQIMNHIKQCPNVRSIRWKCYLVFLGISGINIFLFSSWTNSGTQRINNIGHRKLASERLVPRHGPLNQISNRMPSCLVLIKWLLVLEKVVVSYQRNDTTHFRVRKHVFTGVTYRVWVTQRQYTVRNLYHHGRWHIWEASLDLPHHSQAIVCFPLASTEYCCVVSDKILVQLAHCSGS